MTYPWPGNVRELQNAIEYALVMGQPPFLKLEDLPIHICEHAESEVPRRTSDARSLESVERAHILRILEETGHDQGARRRFSGLIGGLYQGNWLAIMSRHSDHKFYEPSGN